MEQPKGPPLANTITLGVRNVDAQRAFYLALGWPLVSTARTSSCSN
jgi:hypothetical protein